MSEWLEVRGLSSDEAMEAAVRRLGVAPDDMEVEELAADDTGDVVLRVRVRDDREAPQADNTTPPVLGITGITPTEEEMARQRDVVLDFLVDLLEAFDLEGEIAAEYQDGVLRVDINGEDLGSLIGRRGAALGALTEISKTVIQRQTEARVRIQLDVQGYRARRRLALEKYARQLAAEVVESGGEKALEAMSAADRKAVHDAVADVEGVRSYSEGAEPKRYVVISRV